MANCIVVVPSHNPQQAERFLSEWALHETDPRLLLQLGAFDLGCPRKKNAGIHAAIKKGAEIIMVLDDDCYPDESCPTFEDFIEQHVRALEPQPVEMFAAITAPPSRGTPYFNRTITMPVAASMGFWTGCGDYDAIGQLAHGAAPMAFRCEAVHGRYFPLSGMNLAFRANEWPWCQFIDVPRFDDIWMGFLWQRKAYANGQCFNLNGPLVRHCRQSNVWRNLRDEAEHLERNEQIWTEIAQSPMGDYDEILALLRHEMRRAEQDHGGL